MKTFLPHSKTARKIVLMLSLFVACLSFGQTNTWDGSSSNNWNAAANWSLNAVPTSAHDVVININATISVDTSPTINTLTISGNAAVSFTSSGATRTITIDNTGSSIASGSSLTLRGSVSGGGTARPMNLVFTGTSRTMSIAGTLNITDVEGGSSYVATNSVTTVTGTIKNSDASGGTIGTITSTTTNLTFAAGGTYQHDLDGGSIPTATWNSGSTCLVSGLTSTAPTGLTQSFGHFTWNCTAQSSSISLDVSMNIQGDFTVSSTNNQNIRLSDTSTSRTLTIGGDYIQTGGIFRLNNSSGSGAMTVTGDLNLNGGNLTLVSGTSPCTATVGGSVSITAGTLTMSEDTPLGTLNVSGNFFHTGGTITETSSGSGSIVFNGSGTQTYTSGGTLSNTINFTVNSGSILQMGTGPAIISSGSSGTFTLSPGATLGVTSPSGITTSGASGNIQVTGTRTYTSGADYIYNGTSAQVTGNGLTQNTPSDLTINNNAGVTLSAATTISGNLLISQGALSTNNLNMSIGGNWTNNSGFTAGTSTQTFTGASKTIDGTSSTTFGNIAIASGATYTMNNSNTANSLIFTAASASSSLSHASGTSFTVNGAVTINQPGASSVTSSWNINTATATVSGLISYSGTGSTTTSRIQEIVITSGTLNASGGISFANVNNVGRRIVMSGGAGNLNLKGGLALSGQQTLTAGTTSNFSYVDSAAQTVNYFTSGAYNNLNIDNTNTNGATLSAAVTSSRVTGNLTVGGVNSGSVFNNGGFSITLASGKSFSVASGSTFNLTGTSTMAAVSGGGTKTFGAASTTNYGGSGQTVTAETYGNLQLSGSGTKTMPAATITVAGNFSTAGTASATALGAIDTAGNFTLGSGTTFVAGAFTHAVGGNWVNNGGTFTNTGSTFNFNGTTQDIGGTNNTSFNNLTLSGSGTKTLSKSTTIAGNLNIAIGVIANLSTLTTHTTAALTLGGYGAPSGFWGSTASTATNKNDIHFAATGKINVTSNTCTTTTISGTLTICSGLTTQLTGSGPDSSNPWNSATMGVATIGSTGLATALSAGSSVITYTTYSGCTQTATLTVNAMPNNVTNGFTGGTICPGATGTITFNADDTFFATPYSIDYTDGTTTWSQSISSASATTFNVAVNPTTTTNYSLVSITQGTCTRTSGFLNSTAEITVRPVFTPGAINTTGETVCYNGDPVVIGSSAPANGGNGIITYKWQANGVDIPSSNSAIYNPPAGLTATTTYTRFANDGTCNTTPTSSGSWLVTVTPIVGTPTAIIVSGGAEPTCQLTNGITATTYSATATNSTGFNWSLDNSAAGSIDAATGVMTWADGFSGSVVIRTTANGCGGPSAQATRTVLINDLPNAALSGNATICNGTTTDLSVALTGAQPWSITYTDGTTPITITDIASSPRIISVSPGTVTTYSIIAVNDANCNGTFSGNATVNVNPILPVSVNIAPSANPACLGTNVTFTAIPTNGGTVPAYQWKLNGTDVGTNSAIYTNSALANGDAVSCLLTSNETCATGSPATSNTSTMTINNLPSSPTIGDITQPVCPIITGTVVLNGLPSGTWTINPGNIPGTGSSSTVSGISSGTAYFTVTDASGCTSSQSNAVTITNIVKRWVGSDLANPNDWFNDSNWTPEGVPDEDTCIEIPNNGVSVSISGTNKTAHINAVTVASGGNIKVDSGNTLVVKNFVNVNSGGTLTLEDSASLIQISSAPNLNQGNIIVKRNSAPLLLNDYAYWCSPTSGTQSLRDFSPNSNPKYFLAYDNTWSYVSASATKFDSNHKGIGYAIIAPKGITGPTVFHGEFTGVPNNGDITVAISPSSPSPSYRLIGNPYPSALDADAFILENLVGGTGINKTISGALYFWSRTTPLSSKDYSVYNLAGGVPNSSGPKLWIASGQGFIVQTAAATGNITFTNEMRTIGTDYTNSTFSKKTITANSVASLEKNRIWLNLSNGSSNLSQTLIGYIQTATNGYDPGFDGAYLSSSKTGIYSLLGKDAYTIQAKALPFTSSDVVPLGYVTDVKGDAAISIDSVDGLFANGQAIFIEDKLLNVVHDLKAAPYIFATEAGTFNNRFVLRYTDNSLGLNDPTANSNNVIISSNNQQIKIQSATEDIAKVFVYDLLGRTIYKNTQVDRKETIISDLKIQQVLIVKVVLKNGLSVGKKVVY